MRKNVLLLLLLISGVLVLRGSGEEYREFSILQNEFELSISNLKLSKYDGHHYIYAGATVLVTKKEGPTQGLFFDCIRLNSGSDLSQGGRLTGFGEIPTSVVTLSIGETRRKALSWRFRENADLGDIKNYSLVVDSECMERRQMSFKG